MTPAETSRALALAIGYLPEHVRIDPGFGCRVVCADADGTFWCRFDFTEPDVIWPIAERYNAFPVRDESGRWDVPGVPMFGGADTAAEATALAVIGGGRGDQQARNHRPHWARRSPRMVD